MQFKSIEMLGFKSFADKISLDFQPGITAIVGPNGCGKSNVMDAIRWALGEQSAKGLRGERMEDIIFNGSSSRKPVGMAEVSLKLLNNGDLPTEYKEVQITRRLYRSGESDYFLNKTPCRLKDIVDLFLDTGMGHRAYSLVQQGKIDFLLTSKPAERRSFLEEAAGVMKYKTRKKETLAKLELTRQNLLRVSDISVEVKRQLEALKRQAGRARRYKKLQTEEQYLVALLACRQYLDCHEQIKQIQAQYQQTKDVQLANSTKMVKLETDKESLELELLDLGECLHKLQTAKHQQELEQKSAHDRIQHLKEMLEEQGRQHLESEQDILRLHQRIDQAKANWQERQEALKITNRELMQRKSSLEKEQAQVNDLETLVLKQRRQVDEHKNELLEIDSKLVHGHNRLQILETEAQRLTRRKDQQHIEQKLLEAEQTKLKQTLAGIYEEQTGQEDQLKKIIAANQKLQEQIELKIQQLKELDKNLLAQREEYNFKSSHLASLKDLQQNLEGVQEGVRHLLLADSPLPGLLGLVAQLIETKPEYELAIETVLGPCLEYVFTKDHASALQAIQQLEQKQLGRGSFIPSDLPEPTIIPLPAKAKGLAGQALELVSYDNDHALLVRYLLGNVWLAKDLESALNLWQQSDLKPTIVTLQGEVIQADGVMSGGSANNSRLGFLTRKRRLKELKAETAQLESELIRKEQDREKMAAQLIDLNRQRTQTEADQHQVEICLVSLKKDRQRWEDEKQRQEKQAATLAIESQQLQHDEQNLSKEKNKLSQEETKLAQVKEKAKAKLLSLQEQYQINEEQLSCQHQGLTEHKVKLASLQTKKESLQIDIERLQAEQAQISQRMDQRIQHKEKNQARQKEIQAEIIQLQQQEEAFSQEDQGLADKLLAAEAVYQEKTDQLRQIETAVKETRTEHDKWQKQLSELEVQLATLKFKLDENQHQIAPTGHSLSQLMQNFDGATFDPGEAQQKIEKTRLSINKLGAVNLMALEEVQALQERHDFLVSQQEDLNQSSLGLHQAINKINHTTKERFLTTFQEVDEKFRQLCGRLFEGGEGELRLEDEDDLLETGIEILVRPAGKRLRQMSLLSGGEKTMAAIAFLFAIYLVKPSPLCFLDEVDAALDEANVQRLLNIIRELTDKSQFVMITHNRKTMETADLLYGITMETPGISKIVSVKLAQEGVQN